MIMNEKSNLQNLEIELEKVEKELKEANWEEGFEEVLKNYRGEDEVVSFEDYLLSVDKEKRPFYLTNFNKLDDLIQIEEGNLITITGPTGEGKTTFAQNLTAKLDVPSIWFSYEVPTEQLITKFGDKLPKGYVPKSLISRKTIWIERKIVEGIVKYGIKIVFIDHLHYLFNLAETRNPSLEIGEIMRTLKLIAKKYNIIVFLIAHTKMITSEERIGLESIRDSSFVGQESDCVIAIWRKRERQKQFEYRERGLVYKNEAVVSVVKNRRTGKLGSFDLYFHNNCFYEEMHEVPYEMK